MTDLKTRRLRGDLIQMFKLVNKMELVNFKKGINYNTKNFGDSIKYNLRRHSKALVREKIRNCNSRFNFFTNIIVNHWNQLPQETIEAKNLNSFKAKLDQWLLKQNEATAITH